MKSEKKILKPLSGRNPKYLDDYETYTHKECTICKEIKEVVDFAKSVQNNRIGWVYRSYCKSCGNEKTRRYASENKEKRNKRLREYRKNNPSVMKDIDRKRNLKHKYGITVEEYSDMFKRQNGKCFICSVSGKKLVVDHCHKTNEVRKLLCHGCNTVLGKIEKGEFEVFAKYILDHRMDEKCHADLLLELANM